MKSDLYTIIVILFYLIAPLLIIKACKKVKILDKLGPVFFAYAIGLIIGNTPLSNIFLLKIEIQEHITNFSIPLALPMLIFSLEVKKSLKLTGKTFLSMLFVFIGITITVCTGYFLFDKGDSDFWKISGMISGVYTGGTLNLAALKQALNANNETFILLNTFYYEVSSIFLLFYVTFAHKLFSLFLPKFKIDKKNDQNISQKEGNLFEELFKTKFLKAHLKTIGISIVIIALSIVINYFIIGNLKDLNMLVIILSLTSLSIMVSFSEKVNRIPKSFDLGMYIIIIFCLAVASQSDVSQFKQESHHILQYIIYVVTGTLLIQLILSKVFKIDADTMMATSTSLICSPPFVPIVSGAIKNKNIIVPGLTVGIIGYAAGNYFGVLLAHILKNL